MNNCNSENITRLRNLIVEGLQPLITEDFSLLDIPYHNNIGDSLIYLGEQKFLTNISPYKLLYKSSARFGDFDAIPKTGILLLHGGGNFGDIWHESHDFRRQLIEERRFQKIIIFPQTVYYKNESLIKRDSEVYNKHPDLTICARDINSYTILKRNFKNNIILIPDMAFCLDLDAIPAIHNIHKKILFLQRTDLEKPNYEFSLQEYIQKAYPNYKIDIFDWPGMYYTSRIRRMLIERRNRFFKYSYSILKNCKYKKFILDSSYGFESHVKGERLSELGIRFINRYDVVCSNRLHGIILGILMNKYVVCLDNSYGKNRNFFETWLRDFENCAFLSI